MENVSNMKALFIIISAGFAEDVIETAREAGVIGATIIHARGAGAAKGFLGFSVDPEKEIIFSIIDENISEKVMSAVKEKHGITTPARSFCFLMPVDKVLGITSPVLQEKPKD